MESLHAHSTAAFSAAVLTRQAYALLPHVKITDLLLEVDRWTRFTGRRAEDHVVNQVNLRDFARFE